MSDRTLFKVDNEWLEKAIQAIESGLCNKLEKDNIVIYRCAKIIRIDIKCSKDLENIQ